MARAQEVQLQVIDEEAKAYSENPTSISESPSPQLKDYTWWLRMALYTFFVLAGQAVATLLGRLYFEKGGDSKWLSTLTQLVGFPILIPFLFIPLPKSFRVNSFPPQTKKPSFIVLASIYVSLGLILVGDCMLYSIGLSYVPVSTYSLICASQLAFNALFSFLLNKQKFTAPIINSLVILTMSSALLMFQSDSSELPGVSRGQYIIGCLCTVAASAGYALMLSLTQLAFKKVLKKETFSAVLDMIIYQSLVASIVGVVGLFASGEWNDLSSEMAGFRTGEVSYVMNLVWTSVSWAIFFIGAVGMIFEVSSLFSNVISVLGLPIIPVLAVIFFHDKMEGIKIIAMILAIWGFVSYVYQHYIDDLELKRRKKVTDDEVTGAAPSARG